MWKRSAGKWLAVPVLGTLLVVVTAGRDHFRVPLVGPAALQKALSAPDSMVHFEDDAIRFLEDRLRKRGGSDPLARIRLCDLYLSRFKVSGRLEDLRSSRIHLDSLLASDSTNGSFHSRLAVLHLACHRFQEALLAAHQAERLSGRDEGGDAALTLFDALFAAGQYEEAKRRLDRLRSRRPLSFAVLTRRARLLEQAGDIEEAGILMEKAWKDAVAFSSPPPTLAWCLVESGGYEARLGNGRDALAKYLKALETVPGYPPALEGMARLAQALDENPDAARQLYRECIRRGGPPALMLEVMNLERKAGRAGEAEEWKSRFLAEAGRTPETERLFYRPLVRLHLESHDSRSRAVRYAWLDAEDRPTAESQDLLAWALYQNGSIAASYEVSRKALAWGSWNPEILYHASLISWHADKKKEAERLLSRSLEIMRSREKDSGKSSQPLMAAWKNPNLVPGAVFLLYAHSH